MDNSNLPVMTRQQVRDLDKTAIEKLHIPGIVLMENAGINCCQLIIKKMTEISASSACIVCGTGNNGGDGFVIARHLENEGVKTRIVILGSEDKLKGDALANYRIIDAMNLDILFIDPDDLDISTFINLFEDFPIIIDAVFGTGLQGQVRDKYLPIIDAVNQLIGYKIAIDIPSGLDCDTGQPLGGVIKCDMTITLAAMKKGFLNPLSQDYTGKVFVESIGINPEFLSVSQ